VGIHRADHVIPLYPQKLAINFADKWRSLGRYSSLADEGPRSFCLLSESRRDNTWEILYIRTQPSFFCKLLLRLRSSGHRVWTNVVSKLLPDLMHVCTNIVCTLTTAMLNDAPIPHETGRIPRHGEVPPRDCSLQERQSLTDNISSLVNL
jgi:hypothetical protein